MSPTTDAASVVWIEAEHFEEPGGWVNDAQFIDQMGSPYLLANGMGEPVEDATTTIGVPAAGQYRLWVRAKDWYPDHHPGPFQILLDGYPVEHTFGRSGDPGWRWENGGVHQLSGQVSVALHDLTGYYGRCDAIVLTIDLDWTPPEAADAITDLRAKYGGVSPQIEDISEHDVVVIGGGLAGCTAAVAAARNGASVVLLQNRPMLGGNTSPEILVPPVGVWNGRQESPFDPHETGLIEEYRTPGRQVATEGKLYAKRLLRWVKLEPNLDLYLNTHATGVEMKSDSPAEIEAVLAMNVRTGRRMRFSGQIFIDCSGDSVVAVSAGAEYRQGKENRSMHSEPWAPDEPSSNTMGNGLKYYPVDTGTPQPFDAPSWAYAFPDCDSFCPGRHPRELGFVQPDGKGIGQQWILELGGTRDTFSDAEEIRDDLFRLIYGIWDHVKNHCRESAKAETYKLGWVGYVTGKRETRRLIGDYVLTQNDIIDKTPFEDAVAYGAWVIDDHYSDGFFHNGQFGVHQDYQDGACFGEEFSIPFQSFYSRNVDNLMMAGRNISATHLAMSNTRVMLTCALMGHAGGTGAALCVHKELTPRGIYQDCVDQLQQQLLKEGAYIIGLKADDGRDLAPKGAIVASSERTWQSGEAMAAAHVANGYARATDKDTNAWSPEPSKPGPHWIELAWEQPVSFNVIHVSFQTRDLAPNEFSVEVWQDGAWQRVVEIAENRHRRHVLGVDRITASKLRVVEHEPAGISAIRVYDEPQRLVEIAQRAHENMRLPDSGPFLPWEESSLRS
jgi:hypothetical protein